MFELQSHRKLAQTPLANLPRLAATPGIGSILRGYRAGGEPKRVPASCSNGPAPASPSSPARELSPGPHPRIKVVGVGGGGCNAVGQMIKEGIQGVEFLSVDTHSAWLQTGSERQRCVSLTVPFGRGFDCHGSPISGARAAEAAEAELREALRDADLIFIVAGMGGGTGTGAAPVIARIAREEEWPLVVAVVTLPFGFEGRRRREVARQGIAALQEATDTVIAVPNDGLLQVVRHQTLAGALKTVDRLLHRTVRATAEVLTVPGLIDVDFADIRQMMFRRGLGAVGIGSAEGEDRAMAAATAALSSPLLGIPLHRAGTALSVVRYGPDLELRQVIEAQEAIGAAAHREASLLFGVYIDPRMEGEAEVTLIATGIDALPEGEVTPNSPGGDDRASIDRSRQEAEERAEQLVRSVLGDQEYDSLRRLGYLDVASPTLPQRVYRVPARPGPVQVLEGGRCVARLCVVSRESIPAPEVVLIHKLMIEGSEQEYLCAANRLR